MKFVRSCVPLAGNNVGQDVVFSTQSDNDSQVGIIITLRIAVYFF